MSEQPIFHTALQLHGEALYASLYDALVQKKTQHRRLNDLEQVVFVLLALPLEADLYGFANVFIHLYSFHDCVVFETTLRTIGLVAVADQFRAARNIYTNDAESMSEAAYTAIDLTHDPERLRRIEEIGQTLLTDTLRLSIAQNLRAYLQAQLEGS